MSFQKVFTKKQKTKKLEQKVLDFLKKKNNSLTVERHELHKMKRMASRVIPLFTFYSSQFGAYSISQTGFDHTCSDFQQQSEVLASQNSKIEKLKKEVKVLKGLLQEKKDKKFRKKIQKQIQLNDINQLSYFPDSRYPKKLKCLLDTFEGEKNTLFVSSDSYKNSKSEYLNDYYNFESSEDTIKLIYQNKCSDLPRIPKKKT